MCVWAFCFSVCFGFLSSPHGSGSELLEKGDAPPVSGRVQLPGTEMFYLNEKKKEGREKKKRKKKSYSFLKLAIFFSPA